MAKGNGQERTIHNCNAPEQTNQSLELSQSSSENLTIQRYEGEIKREKTKTIDQGMPEIGAELDLLDTVEQVLSSDKDEGAYKQLIELYNGENTVGEVEQELNSNGYSIVDAREATRLLEEEQVLEIEEPGVYKTNSQAESLYQVLDAL